MYKRIFNGYIAVLLCFTVLFGVLFCLSRYGAVKNGFEQESEAALERLAKRSDVYLGMMREALERLFKEKEVADYASAAETEAYAAPLQETIARNAGSLSRDGISVHISKLEYSLDRVVGAEKTERVYDFLSSLQFGNGSGDVIKQYFAHGENDKVFVRYCPKSAQRKANSLLVVKRQEIDGTPIFAMCVADVDALFGSRVQNGGSAAILDEQSIICNIGTNTLNTTEEIEKILSGWSMGAFPEGNIYRGGYMYTAAASDIYNWRYVMATPADALPMSMAQSVLGAVALGFVLLALGWCLAAFLTKRTYKPLDAMLRRFPNYKELLTDEDAFAEETLRAMNEEKKKTEEQMAALEVLLRDAFFRDLLFGIYSSAQLGQKLSELNIEDMSGPFRVVLLEVANYDLIAETLAEETAEEIKRQIEEFIDDQMKEQIVHRTLRLDAKSLAVILHGAQMRPVRELLMDMVMMVEGSFDAEVAGAIGEDCEELAQVCVSYNSARRIMERHVSLGSRSAIVTEEDISVVSAEGLYYPLDTERELITAVIRANAEGTDRIIDDILKENFESKKFTKDRLDAFAFAIAATISRVLESLNKTAAEVFGDGSIIFLELKMCRGAEELEKKVHELFKKVILHINAENKLAEDDLSDRLLSYIHSHYNEDISLLNIGGHFNLSQCYISTLFKDATGENFKDYLSRYRIKKAKEILLDDPTIKNSELAKMIGCNTVATLFRLFNKYEGLSPGQYMKNLKQEIGHNNANGKT